MQKLLEEEEMTNSQSPQWEEQERNYWKRRSESAKIEKPRTCGVGKHTWDQGGYFTQSYWRGGYVKGRTCSQCPMTQVTL